MDSDMSMHASYAFKHTCWGILLLFLAGGVADCSVVVTVSGPHVAKVGSNVTLNVFITGATRPTIVWAMGDIPVVTWTLGSSSPPDILDPGGVLSIERDGSLSFHNVLLNYSATYTIRVVELGVGSNTSTFTLRVFERPSGDPMCSVTGVNGNQDLQYRCQWAGGTPEAQLSFPVLNATSSGSGDFNLTRKPSQDLNGKEVTCVASHPFLQRNCSVTARGPADFQPLVSSMVDADKKLVITIACASTSLPVATVTWSKGNQILTSGGRYQISSNTTLLFILDFHLNSTELGTYTCNAVNILGNQTNDVSVLGPTVSDLGLFPNQEGTMVTLTWETPRTSVITGFEVQMMGPSLLPSPGGRQRRKRATNEFGTIQEKPSSARSTNISGLDPKATYRFRVIPTAGATRGQPSKELRAGPGGGLSGPAIAGIAAGIPCGILLILIIIALIILCVVWRRKRRQTRYPVSRAVEKVVATQPNLNTPHTLLTGGLKTSAGPPDYSVHLASERSSTLPSVVSPPPVRMATTV
ncbi:V-set and immunoglobulin domain-containing protein 10-like isoform X3 [Megalops cyprinoides]|uniref:V-set and immunoglobulin domain-containing protein 10-like isoform X3 n=1 Tax=Megalops cyprinoides TaxID=118141 RepID=UPI001865524F|nr:V-set and immunoglobulin domain-containing protein 10-like isoform X3 [Megalops cyprinoides]